MAISFGLMGSDELRRLIRSPASGAAFPEDTVKFLSIADVVLEIEHVKKREPGNSTLTTIRDGKCRFREATNRGYAYTVTLDTDAVKNGLFESVDSFYNVDFWKPVLDRQTQPSWSVRLACFRSYDLNCGTRFHLEILGRS